MINYFNVDVHMQYIYSKCMWYASVYLCQHDLLIAWSKWLSEDKMGFGV